MKKELHLLEEQENSINKSRERRIKEREMCEQKKTKEKTLLQFYNKVTMATTPEIIIKIPAILLTHLRPITSNFFLKSVAPELSEKNHKNEPAKTPATRVDEEKRLSPFPKPSAAKTAIKAKIVNGFVSVRKTVVKYDLSCPPFSI